MKGLDTNVLVRYLTQDDPSQFAAARDLLEEAERSDERLYVNAIVLCELVWVLRGTRYRRGRAEIVEALEKLLDVPLFELESRDQVAEALVDYRSGTGDFADYLIGRLNAAAGCRDTATFDMLLSDCQDFDVLVSAAGS